MNPSESNTNQKEIVPSTDAPEQSHKELASANDVKEEQSQESIPANDKAGARKQAKLEKKLAKEEAVKKKKMKEEQEKQKKEMPEKEIKEKEIDYYKSEAKLIRLSKGEPVFYQSGKENILITSALPYVNNVPHLGNLIGCVLSADVYSRFCRLSGINSLYICGTDEYGTATETKAIEERVSPRELCDKFHYLHSKVYEWFDIDFDYFGRTSTPIHSEITHDIFLNLQKSGYVKKQEVEQFKCNNCNIFLSDRYVLGTCYHQPCAYPEARGDQCDLCGKLCNALELIDPKCKLCKTTPTREKSFHYFIELPSVESLLQEWFSLASTEGNWSNNSKTITSSFISEGLRPRCITRDLKWGVPVPTEDEDLQNKVFYVWFDAPIGYLSITANFIGERWVEWWKNPENVKLYQFMGKDNVPFHTVIFPSTLIGTGEKYTLVHHLSTTEYLNYEGKKFSKSHGVGVFGDMAKDTGIPCEIWRYYLLAMRPELSDTDFKWDDFMAKNNNELLANLGNLVNRVLQFTIKNFDSKVPALHSELLDNDKDIPFLKDLNELILTYIALMKNVKIKDGLKTFMEISALANAYLQNAAPWNLIKKNTQGYNLQKAETVINILCNVVRLLGCLGEPFMPSFSAKLYEILNIPYTDKEITLIKAIIDFQTSNVDYPYMFLLKLGLVEEGHVINQALPLFKKMNEKEVEEFKKSYGGLENESILPQATKMTMTNANK